jgi:UDP-glucose 4-epimerase
VGPGDAVTVTEIAEMAVECLGLETKPRFDYTGGDRGWKGDVPVVRLDAARLRSLGWAPAMNSRQAIDHSLRELVADVRITAEPTLAR